MEHYYSQAPNTPHDIRSITYDVNNIHLDLLTDAGVFSKASVDYGSDTLIRSLPPLQGNILDMGCGYGVIGLALSKLNPDCSILLVDINERAVNLTQQNIHKNKIANAHTTLSDGFSSIQGKFDTIVCNPPIRTGKSVLYPLFEMSIDYLNPEGALYIVIQKKQGANSAINKLISIYGNCEIVNKDRGYWIIKSIKSTI